MRARSTKALAQPRTKRGLEAMQRKTRASTIRAIKSIKPGKKPYSPIAGQCRTSSRAKGLSEKLNIIKTRFSKRGQNLIAWPCTQLLHDPIVYHIAHIL